MNMILDDIFMSVNVRKFVCVYDEKMIVMMIVCMSRRVDRRLSN